MTVGEVDDDGVHLGAASGRPPREVLGHAEVYVVDLWLVLVTYWRRFGLLGAVSFAHECQIRVNRYLLFMMIRLLVLLLLLTGCYQPSAVGWSNSPPSPFVDGDDGGQPTANDIRWPELYARYFKPKCAHCHHEWDTELGGYGAMFGSISLLKPQPVDGVYQQYDPPIMWDPLLVRLMDGKIDPRSPLIDPQGTYLFIMSEPGGGFSGAEPNMPFDEVLLAGEFPSAKLADPETAAMIRQWTACGAPY